jgi:hypothetical protein
VDSALEPQRYPQSGALMAWDTLAVLMAGYESSENGGAFVDLQQITRGRQCRADEMPDPRRFGGVFQRKSG